MWWQQRRSPPLGAANLLERHVLTERCWWGGKCFLPIGTCMSGVCSGSVQWRMCASTRRFMRRCSSADAALCANMGHSLFRFTYQLARNNCLSANQSALRQISTLSSPTTSIYIHRSTRIYPTFITLIFYLNIFVFHTPHFSSPNSTQLNSTFNYTVVFLASPQLTHDASRLSFPAPSLAHRSNKRLIANATTTAFSNTHINLNPICDTSSHILSQLERLSRPQWLHRSLRPSRPTHLPSPT